MTKTTRRLLIAVLMLFFVSSQSFARSAPSGSYKRSGKDIKVKRHHLVNFNLYATCKNRRGHWVRSKFKKYRRCRGDIANVNGQLRCVARRVVRDHRRRPHASGRIPQGSYQRSCRYIRVRRYTLIASCRSYRGYWSRTSLYNYRRCRNDIKNINGRLNCGRTSYPLTGSNTFGHVPRGSYKYSCRNIHVYGRYLKATCRTRRGYWNRTSLRNYRGCLRDIININGVLSCTRSRRRPHRSSSVPHGSYQRSCRGAYINHLTLIAKCRTRRGYWNRTKLYDYRYCRSDISNRNGRLSCRR